MRATPSLPAPLDDRLREIGDGVSTARLRRGWSQAVLADKADLSFHTIRAIEQGNASTAFGNYLKVLWVLGLMSTADDLARPELDDHGLALEASERRKRGGRGATSISNDF